MAVTGRDGVDSVVPQFDVDTAITVLRGAGYHEEALYLAQKQSKHDWYLKIQIEDKADAPKALDYISQLPFEVCGAAVEKSLVTRRRRARRGGAARPPSSGTHAEGSKGTGAVGVGGGAARRWEEACSGRSLTRLKCASVRQVPHALCVAVRRCALLCVGRPRLTPCDTTARCSCSPRPHAPRSSSHC